MRIGVELFHPLEGDDVRESMVGAVSIRLKDPVFESQTKNKLGNTEIRTELVNRVREELLHFFNRNKDMSAVLKQIPELVKAHSNFKHEVADYKRDTAFRYILHHNGDKDHELTLTVLVFDVPR